MISVFCAFTQVCGHLFWCEMLLSFFCYYLLILLWVYCNLYFCYLCPCFVIKKIQICHFLKEDCTVWTHCNCFWMCFCNMHLSLWGLSRESVCGGETESNSFVLYLCFHTVNSFILDGSSCMRLLIQLRHSVEDFSRRCTHPAARVSPATYGVSHCRWAFLKKSPLLVLTTEH